MKNLLLVVMEVEKVYLNFLPPFEFLLEIVALELKCCF